MAAIKDGNRILIKDGNSRWFGEGEEPEVWETRRPSRSKVWTALYTRYPLAFDPKEEEQ
jgi:hypothetical protein